MFRRYPSTVNETCSCGATFEYVGDMPNTAVANWRTGHPCPNRKPPGPWTTTRPATAEETHD